MLLAVFGGIFLYCLYGAVNGTLFIPSRNGGPGTELSGVAAWAMTAAPLLLYMGVLLRHRALLPNLHITARTVLELGLLAAGVGLAMFGVMRQSDRAVARCKVSIKPQPGHFAFGIPPVPPETMTIVSETSKVVLRIDGRRVGEMLLGDTDPQINFKVAPGVHDFEFTADIVAHGSVPYGGRCSGVLQAVAGKDLVLRPWLDFSAEPTDHTLHKLTSCELIPW